MNSQPGKPLIHSLTWLITAIFWTFRSVAIFATHLLTMYSQDVGLQLFMKDFS
jgi:hypothetical protein